MPLKIRIIKSNPTTAPGHGPSTEFFLPMLGSVLTEPATGPVPATAEALLFQQHRHHNHFRDFPFLVP